MDVIPDRYEHEPMLAIVENYILDTLGQLAPEKAALLNQIVCRTFGGKNWRATIREQFQLSDDASLRALWKQRVEEAQATQQELAPEDFAREIADEVFDGLGGGEDEGKP